MVRCLCVRSLSFFLSSNFHLLFPLCSHGCSSDLLRQNTQLAAVDLYDKGEEAECGGDVVRTLGLFTGIEFAEAGSETVGKLRRHAMQGSCYDLQFSLALEVPLDQKVKR